MKNLFLFVLILTLILQIAAFAADSRAADTEKFLKIVKERIGSTDEYDKVTTDSRTDEDGTVYSFEWSCENDNDFKNLYVSIKDNGVITSYNKYSSEYVRDDKLSFAKLSNAELSEKIIEFAEKINPSLAGKVKVWSNDRNESISGGNRNFTVQLFENGLPVRDNSGYVAVTADGEVTNFRIDYTDGVEYENVDKIIDFKAAAESYKENFGFELCYQREWDGRGDGYKNVLVWLPKDRDYEEYISAVTGEVVKRISPTYDHYFGRNGAMESKAAADESGGASYLSPAETAELEKIAGLISEKEAERLVRSNKAVKLSDKLTLKSVNLYKDKYNEKAYLYRLYFSDDDKTDAYAAVNAETGEITAFSKYTYNDKESDKKLDSDKLKELGEAALKSLAPKYFPSKDENNGFRFSELHSSDDYLEYTRYVNGIRCDFDNISVNIDEETGELLRFNLNRSKESFPLPEGILDIDTAADIIFDKAVFEPMYVFTCSSEELKKYDKAVAVYYLGGNTVIDAFTGKQMNEEVKTAEEYTDISGHYAEKAITTLCGCGIGYGGSEYKPQEYITQKDFLAFLRSVFESYSSALITEDYDYEAAYRFAYNRGILEKGQREPDAAVSREQAAVMLVSALGYREVADIEGIYKPMFADVAENTGSISILAGMKVIGGDGNGNFNPAGLLTRADAAVILYNYLSR